MAVTHPATSAVVDEQVLEIVARLVDELSAGAARRPMLQDSLDRDLGISSLERVELLLRLEQAFGVRLSDSVMAEAATPQDLVTAILHAVPGGPEPAPPAVREVAASTTPAPASVPTAVRSLVETFRWHVERSPDRIHIHTCGMTTAPRRRSRVATSRRPQQPWAAACKTSASPEATAWR